MQPLIQAFTKNLSPCTGCGKTVILEKGVSMIFIIQVQVEAENARQAMDKVNEGDVISVNPRPQQAQSGQGQVGAVRLPISAAQPARPTPT